MTIVAETSSLIPSFEANEAATAPASATVPAVVPTARVAAVPRPRLARAAEALEMSERLRPAWRMPPVLNEIVPVRWSY